MDIGSAKPTPDERSAVKYHLLDIADPTEEYSAANFAADAHVAAKQIASRGALPIVVGGTGFYVQWLVFGSPGAPPATAEAAARAEETIESFAGDWEAAKSAGMKIDAEYCDSVLKDNDWFRLRRVFEVYYSSGRPLSSFDRPQGKNMTPSQVYIYTHTHTRTHTHTHTHTHTQTHPPTHPHMITCYKAGGGCAQVSTFRFPVFLPV